MKHPGRIAIIGIIVWLVVVALVGVVIGPDTVGPMLIFFGIMPVLLLSPLWYYLYRRSRGPRPSAREKREAQKQREYRRYFEEAVESFSEIDIMERPISATATKLVVGAVIVGVTTYLGALVDVRQGYLISFLGCILGLWLVGAVLFKGTNPLDRRRWRHYWQGDVVGYWIIYFIMLTSLSGSRFRTIEEAQSASLSAYIVACLGGMAVGFLNVWRTDNKEKSDMLSQYQAWAGASQEPLASAEAEGITWQRE